MEFVLTVVLLALGMMWLGVVFIGPPFVPTLQRDLDVLFAGLKLTDRDHVVDLGAGDGRVLNAVVATGASATGVEINPMLSWIARWRLRGTGARVVTKNMWQYELPADTTYVFIFCASQYIPRMDQYLKRQVANGRRFQVISYGFTLDKQTPSHVLGSFNIYDF